MKNKRSAFYLHVRVGVGVAELYYGSILYLKVCAFKEIVYPANLQVNP